MSTGTASTPAIAASAGALQRASPDDAAAYLRALLSRVSDVVVVVDAHGIVRYAGAAFAASLDREPDAVIGTPLADLVHPDDRATVGATLSATQNDAVDRMIEVRLRAAGGRWGWFESTVANALDDPAVGGLVVSLRDVGERRAARAALRDVDERQRAILGKTRDIAVFFEADATIAWVSPACEEYLQVSPDQLVGTVGWELIHPDDRDRALEALAATNGPGTSARAELRVQLPDGTTRWVEEIVTDHLDNPAIGYIVGHLHDITERKAHEAELQFHAQLLESVAEAVTAVDGHSRVTYWNAGAERLYGWTRVEAIGCDLRSLTNARESEEVARTIMASLLRDGHWSGDLVARRKDGTQFPAFSSNTAVRDERGGLIGVIGVSTDLTERLRLTQRVEQDRARLARAQQSAHMGSFEIDLDTGAAVWSDELCRILGLPLDAAPSRTSYEQRIHPDDRAAVLPEISRVLDSGETPPESVHRIVRTDGAVRWVRVRVEIAPDLPRLVTATVLDITERKDAEDRLEYQATHDPLTGVANRTRISELLAERLEHGTSPRRPFALAFFDIDRFKVVNDTAGHAVGDEVLRAVAQRLVASDPSCRVGRFGGDEFIVICDQVADRREAWSIADELCATLDEPVSVSGRTLSLRARVGIVMGDDGSSPSELLRSADAALHEAKRRRGKRVWVFDDALRARTRRRAHLELSLEHALDAGQLHLVYQPVVRLADGGVAGFEALLRWTHPDLGPIPPDEFVPIAEETGQIGRIGAWVLDQALAELAECQRISGRRDVWASVNVSAVQLATPEIVEQVRVLLERSGVEPAMLHLEITESVIMDDVEGSLTTFAALGDTGARLSIDDFGTGYSSLSYLSRLPVQTLKIDRSFVHGVEKSSHATSIVAAVVQLAEALSLDTVAEGVETLGELAVLRDLGCGLGQGFLWARPMLARDLRRALAAAPALRA